MVDHSEYDHDWRLRMETKLDHVSEAIVSLARMEERMITLFSRMDTYDQRQSAYSDRIGLIYDRVVELEKSSLTIKAIERVMYILGSAGIASLFWYVQNT